MPLSLGERTVVWRGMQLFMLGEARWSNEGDMPKKAIENSLVLMGFPNSQMFKETATM